MLDKEILDIFLPIIQMLRLVPQRQLKAKVLGKDAHIQIFVSSHMIL